MEFSDDQREAIDGARKAMLVPASRAFRLVGSAGTGKTQVLSEIAKDVSAATLAPTNKACAVLRARGVPATTIHSQIYAPESASLREELAATLDALENCDGDEKIAMEAKVAELEMRLEESEDATDLRFFFRPVNNLNEANVIVDEASMVGEKVLGDILRSSPRNVLLCGDTAQLPPIQDHSCLGLNKPDWRLTTQHRTGEQRKLAELAHLVWNEGNEAALDYATTEGAESESIVVMNKGEGLDEKLALMDATLGGGTIWLCGQNKTRFIVNKTIRTRLMSEWKIEESDLLSPVPKELLSAYARDQFKDRWYNGSEAIVTGVESRNVPMFDGMRGNDGSLLHVRIDGGKDQLVKVAFNDFDPNKPMAHRPTWQYGYCRTVHKAQGSEWDVVVVVDDWNRANRKSWLYTALTRARKKVVWIQ